MCVISAVFVGGLHIKSIHCEFSAPFNRHGLEYVAPKTHKKFILAHVFYDKFLLDLNVYLLFEDDITAR